MRIAFSIKTIVATLMCLTLIVRITLVNATFFSAPKTSQNRCLSSGSVTKYLSKRKYSSEKAVKADSGNFAEEEFIEEAPRAEEDPIKEGAPVFLSFFSSLINTISASGPHPLYVDANWTELRNKKYLSFSVLRI